MWKRLFPLLLLLTSLAWSESATELEAKVREVMPSAQERVWSDIPWRVDLNEARQDAVKSKKPIFVWVMDGHVLAAT